MSNAAAQGSRSVFRSAAADYAFVVAPFWIGALYLGAVTLFPEYRTLVFFVFLFLLGEMHFGSTWLFFFTRENREWIRARRVPLIYGSIALVAAYVMIGLHDIGLALLIGGAASGYHVTRQSIGVYRLYGGRHNDLNEFAIYICSFGFIGIGFTRFELGRLGLPGGLEAFIATALLPGTLVLIAAMAIYFAMSVKRTGNARRWFALVTGCVMYLPYSFVTAPQDAIAIGVGMHWCQYLALNYAVYNRRAVAAKTEHGRRRSFSERQVVVFFIAAYALIMAGLGTSFGSEFRSSNVWLLVPLCGQMIHYYVDAFIWRFSDPHIRNEVGAFVAVRERRAEPRRESESGLLAGAD